MSPSSGRKRPQWNQYAMLLAWAAATRSQDPFVQVGACILRHDHSVLSLGYNGAPPGVEIDWTDRDKRRPLVIHAEMNALRYIKPGEGEIMAVTLLPCHDCLKSIASYGITDVYFQDDPIDTDEASELLVFRAAMQFSVNLWRLTPWEP